AALLLPRASPLPDRLAPRAGRQPPGLLPRQGWQARCGRRRRLALPGRNRSMSGYKPGEKVVTQDGTTATFVRYLEAPYGGRPAQAIIRVGLDTRVVDPVSLKEGQ